MAEKLNSKPKALSKLKTLVPKKKNYIIVLPDEIEEGAHWLFWVLVILIMTFLVSVVIINYTDFPKTLSLLF